MTIDNVINYLTLWRDIRATQNPTLYVEEEVPCGMGCCSHTEILELDWFEIEVDKEGRHRLCFGGKR